MYATDVAKMVQAPIFHVNGDDPEACVRVARLAFEFRQAFDKDVVIDMWCYRRHGHNEGDDPSYTQPLMYERIDERRSVRKLYIEALVSRGDITMEEAEQALADFSARLQAALDETRSRRHRPRRPRARRARSACCPHVETGVDRADARPRLRRARHACPTASPSTRSWPSSSSSAAKLWDEGEVDWGVEDRVRHQTRTASASNPSAWRHVSAAMASACTSATWADHAVKPPARSVARRRPSCCRVWAARLEL